MFGKVRRVLPVILAWALPLSAFEGPESIVNYWKEPEYHVVLRSMRRELAKVPKWSFEEIEEAKGLVLKASKGELDSWKETPKGRLALILVLDQFPRALWHHTAEAYRYDAQAVSLTMEGIETGADKALSSIEKLMFYFPLLHSEELVHQHLAVQKLKSLVTESGEPLFEDQWEMALFRKDLIERYGRFPQRNEFLGRLSADDELDAIKKSPIKH